MVWSYTIFLFQIVCKYLIALFFFNFRDYCNDGYKGVFCENRCPYPTFGSQCSERCHCSIEFCDHTSGCRAPGKKNVEIEMNKDIIFIGTRHRLQKFVSGGGGLHFYLISIWSLDQLLVNACDVSYYRGMDAFHGHNLLFSTKYWEMLIFVLF